MTTRLAAFAIVISLLGAARTSSAASISGRVTDASGAPIAQASVTITGLADEFVIGPVTDASGNWSWSGLPVGTYFVTAQKSGYLPQTYGSTCVRSWCRASNGTPIVLSTAGQFVLGIDIAVQPGARIEGTVTAADSLAASSTTVRVYTTAGEFVAIASTDFAGRYAAGPLRAGAYYVVFSPSFAGYEQQAYGGLRCRPSCLLGLAQPVTVAAGAVTGGIDITLSQSTGSISGQVSNAGSGFTSIRIRERASGMQFVGTVEAGAYTITGVPPGSYSVWIDMAPADRVRQVYGGGPLVCANDAASCDRAKSSGIPITLAAGEAITGIDFALQNAASISGEARQSATGELVTAMVTIVTQANVTVASIAAFDGRYTVGGLAPGRYFAWASSAVTPLKPQIYSGTACAAAPCAAVTGTPIDVAAGAAVSGVNFSLAPALSGVVAGHVRDAAGAAIPGTLVQLWNNAGSLPLFAVAGSTGAFAITAPTGTYYARTMVTYGNAAEFVDEWHGDVCVGCSAAKGTAIDLTAGGVPNVDFVLSRGGSIAGTVTRPRVGLGVAVEAFNDRGELIRSVNCTTPSPCFYRLDGLPLGNYRVRARDLASTLQGMTNPLLIDQVYPLIDCVTADCLDGAVARFQVSPGGIVAPVDFVMRLGGRIQGRAFAADLPLETFGVTGFTVEIVDVRGRRVGNVLPYFDQFHAGGLPAGTYYVRTTNGQSRGYADELYQDVACDGCPPQSGTPIRVIEGEITTGIELRLERAGGITGTAADAASAAPLENVEVHAYTLAGTRAASALSDPAGAWEIRGLPSGDYFLATSNTRLYEDVVYGAGPCAPCDVTRGTRVIVSPGAPNAPIQIRLSQGGGVSGTIRDASGVGLPGVPVSVVSPAGQLVSRVITDSGGRYRTVVAPQTVLVRTDPFAGTKQGMFDGVVCGPAGCDPALGTAVPIVASGLRDAVDISLSSCGTLNVQAMPPQTRYLRTSAGVMVRPFGGVPPYRFSLVSGSIPTGWRLDPEIGSALGVAVEAGHYTYTVGIIDAAGCTTSQTVTVSIVGCHAVVDSDTVGVPAGASSRALRLSGTCPAELFSNASWISLSSSFVGAPAIVTMTVQANPGPPREGTIAIGARLIRVLQAGAASAPPFGALDVPREGAVVHGSIAIGGWALDDVAIDRIAIYRDAVAGEPGGPRVYIGDAVRVRGARPDVDREYPTLPEHERAGWGYLLLTNMLPGQGNGTFRLHAVARDAEGYEVLLGSRTIVANNRDATLPFGAIDTPAQGEVIGGRSYVNFGWSLTPLPKTIPVNGSTIHVIVDGVSLGTVTYDNFREDVATLFPGLNNTQGAVGYRSLDTTLLGDGVHTIAWVVTDDQGGAAGIGSRYFTVANGTALRASPALRAAAAAAPAREIVVRELQRVEFDVAGVGTPCSPAEAYERVGGERRALPVGSTFDAGSGRFSWQPGPGFIGPYDLVFTAPACGEPIVVRVTIVHAPQH